MKKAPIYILLFYFSVLFIALFFGDGKQPIIDVFITGAFIALFFVHKYVNLRIVIIPQIIRVLFVCTLLGSFISLIFSQSIGISVYAYVRLLFALVAFYLFYSISSLRVLRIYSLSLLVFVFGAIGSSVVITLFTGYINWIPRMNLLTSSYGHNHLADIILFALPLAGVEFFYLQTKRSGVALFILLVALFFTFARGAWLPVLLIFLFFGFVKNKEGHRATIPLLFSLCIIAFLITTLVLSANKKNISVTNPSFQERVIKSSPRYDQRLAYWKQAAIAIVERPLVGNGPGTFSLVSRRLQQNINAYSWYAHSFFLQTLAESGVIGATPLFVLIGFILYNTALNKKFSGLYLGLLSAIIYSFYEFNVDFLVVWLLFWSGAGLLMGVDKEDTRFDTPIELKAALAVLVIFYLSSVASMATSKFPWVSFYLAPYNEVSALVFIQDEPRDTPLLELFHKKSPEILFELGYFEQATEAYPLNDVYQRAYAKTFFSGGQEENLEKYINVTCLSLTRKNQDCHVAIPKTDYGIVYNTFKQNIELLSNGIFSEAFQKVTYLAGLDLLESNPIITKGLWEMARSIEPSWGYYHIDLASLEHYVFRDDAAAINTLMFCQNYPDVKQWCKELSGDLNTLPPVGAVEKNIRAIPKIL